VTVDKNKEKVVEKLKNWIVEKHVISLDETMPVMCDDKEERELRDGTKKTSMRFGLEHLIILNAINKEK